MMNENNSFTEKVNSFLDLLEQGKSLKAIEIFYAEEAVQYENYKLLLTGKAKLYAHEQMSIKNVNSFRIKCDNVVVDEKREMVWGEMKIEMDHKKIGKKKMTEAFFQKWSEGKIVEQKFYYKGFQD